MANKKDWRKLLELFRILIRPFSWIFYLISGLIPRRKDVWVFGNVEKSVFVDKFADSSKYLFLEINEKYKDKIVAVWITSNKNTAKELAKHGYKAYTKWSTKGLYYTLKAKYWIFTHSYINPWLSRKSVKINLWHGIPLKKIMYDSKKGADYRRYVRLKNPFKKYIYFLLTPWMMEKTYYLATSPLVAKIFSSAFRTPINRVLISIYPRCKIFFEDIKGFEIGLDTEIYSKVIQLKNRGFKIILYAPTFRDDKTDNKILEVIDFSDLDKFLQKNNAILLVKPHPFSVLTKMRSKITGKNIYFVDPSSDIYPFLKHVDLLITDYSSIYFDFLLLDRPIIFFCFDLEDYLAKNRDMYFEYNKVTPGDKARNYAELKTCIIKALKGQDEYSEERRKIKNIMFNYKSENLVELVMKLEDQ